MSVTRTFRTWCVRSCDGYYFPVSFSTTRDHFAADQAVCEQRCPGAEPQIYYHRNPGETPENMVSLEGSPYTELPAAFSYRNALNPSCSCSRPQGVDDLLTPAIGDTTHQRDTVATAPLPRPRYEPGEDPETLANRDGHFVPGTFAPSHPLLASSEHDGGASVRVVWADEPNPVVMSPVPNDYKTSLLWASSE
jgi:Protein of unknown function (DUF2865)